MIKLIINGMTVEANESDLRKMLTVGERVIDNTPKPVTDLPTPKHYGRRKKQNTYFKRGLPVSDEQRIEATDIVRSALTRSSMYRIAKVTGLSASTIHRLANTNVIKPMKENTYKALMELQTL